MGKKNEFVSRFRKAAPIAAFFILCVIDILVCGRDFGIRHIVVNLMFVAFILLLGSSARHDKLLSVLLPSVAAAVWLISALLQDMKTLLPSISVLALSQIDLVFMTISKYKNIRTLFKNSQVVENIAESAKYHRYMVLYIICFLMAVIPSHGGVCAVILSVLSIAAMCFMCWQMWQPMPSYCLLDKGKYLQVLAMARGKLKDNLVPEDAEGREMDETYMKAQACMRDSRPYLDANLSLDDLARMLGTNKVYLSRAINVVSGRNFCQFVNYYRIQFAKERMKANPRCKMIEVALESGFHSVVTFNMAFKLNEGATPSEWLRERMDSLN